MKNNLSFLLFVIVLCFKDFVESEDINCEIKGSVKVCKFKHILISVEFNNDHTAISDESISLIMPWAFNETRTIILILNFAEGPLTIGPESFKGLEEIVMLDLSSDRSTITLKDDTFLYTPKLQTLRMTLDEATTTLSNKFQTLKELTRLIIFGGHLEIIKNDTFTSANNKLEVLKILSCSIFSIEPKTFVNLINLETLDLSDNSLMRIAPGTFDGLSKLGTLILRENNIYKIKEPILNDLVSLYNFDIRDNDLTEIFNEIFYNTKIQYLYFNNNRLKIVQKELFNYTNSKLIKTIDLGNNFIDRIEKGTFAGLKQLNSVCLSNNKLQVITKGDWGLSSSTYIECLDE